MKTIVNLSWWRRAWDVVSDLVIVTAVVWALPLLLGGAAAVVRLFVH